MSGEESDADETDSVDMDRIEDIGERIREVSKEEQNRKDNGRKASNPSDDSAPSSNKTRETDSIVDVYDFSFKAQLLWETLWCDKGETLESKLRELPPLKNEEFQGPSRPASYLFDQLRIRDFDLVQQYVKNRGAGLNPALNPSSPETRGLFEVGILKHAHRNYTRSDDWPLITEDLVKRVILDILNALDLITDDPPGESGEGMFGGGMGGYSLNPPTEEEKDTRLTNADFVRRHTEDLVDQVRLQSMSPVVGRDSEIERMVDVLNRPGKPNVLLQGRAGTGKTAVVEELARRIANDDIPSLEKHRILQVDIGNLVSGTKYRGTFEKRIHALMEFAAARDDVILFLDELHMASGAGNGEDSSLDFMNHVKTYLDRGDTKIIGATTTQEYRQHLKDDSAFDRRLNPIRIEQLSPDETREVLRAVSEHRQEQTGVRIPEGLPERIVDLSKRCLKHRVFPDKAIDLLDQSLGDARSKGNNELDERIVKESVYRLLGFRLEDLEDLGEHLDGIAERLGKELPLTTERAEEIEDHLKRTIPGRDLLYEQPNLVVGIRGSSYDGKELARSFSRAIFGKADRANVLDLPEEGFYDLQEAPLDKIEALSQLSRMPASVLYCEFPQPRSNRLAESIQRVCDEGYLNMDQDQPVYFSDAVLLFPVSDESEPTGFLTERKSSVKENHELSAVADFVINLDMNRGNRSADFIRKEVFPEIARAYRDRQGIELEANPSLIDRMTDWDCTSRRDWLKTFAETFDSLIQDRIAERTDSVQLDQDDL